VIRKSAVIMDAHDTCARCGHARVFHDVGTGRVVPHGKAYCDDRHAPPCDCTGFVETPVDLEPAPIPMLLWCPECGERHIDEGEFATKKHHTHACQHCGHVWRPAIVATSGVQFLPGFKS
jgi:predicted RNA-binding Zn-ribbon protein involved in translation (DUF1610 family)